jgi:4-hydroxythreonine-4-phosphate dehydrogenase
LSSSLRRLGITLGDPGGIGPEVALKAVYESTAVFVPVIFGPVSVLDHVAALTEKFDIHFLAMPKNGEKHKGLRPLNPGQGQQADSAIMGIQPFDKSQGPAKPFENPDEGNSAIGTGIQRAKPFENPDEGNSTIGTGIQRATPFENPFVFSFPAEPGKKKQVFWVSTGDTPLDIGTVCAANGTHAYTAIQLATEACLSGQLDGIVTAPICKEAMAMAGAPFTDHTTLLASLAQAEVSMGFYSGPLRVVLVSVHCALSDVGRHITPDTLGRACRHAVTLARYHRQRVPKEMPIRIAVAGLNPHAGENGLFGHEEIAVIAPTIAALRAEGLPVEGPFPADTLFHHAYQGAFDVVVAMYHDQGLIPVKMLAFDTAVNVTIGLPFVRTSPDHGTAFSLAYQDKADHGSFAAALDLALHWDCR